jgi:hypothetical protein
MAESEWKTLKLCPIIMLWELGEGSLAAACGPEETVQAEGSFRSLDLFQTRERITQRERERERERYSTF